MHTQKVTNTLIDNAISYVNEIVLSTVDNEVCYLKDVLKQEDKSAFIKAMVTEIDTHERRNH